MVCKRTSNFVNAGVELDTDCANYILKDYVRDTAPTDVSLMRYVAP